MFGRGAFATLPFADLFRTGARLTGMATLAVSLEYRIYVSSREWATEPTDTPPSQPFFGTLTQPLSFQRSIRGGDTIGHFTSSGGTVEIANADGFYDFLVESYVVDGRDVTVKVGVQGDAYTTFFTIFSGLASDWSIEEDAVRIEVTDHAYKLQVPAQADTYAGTGGLEGGADLTGKRVPWALGYVYEAQPPLVIPGELLYEVGDVASITAVYDRGVALTFQLDYATVALLRAASVTAGKYSTCIADGYVKLGSTPTGTITADLVGTVTTAATIVQEVLETSTALVYPDDFYLPSFTAVETRQPAQLGYWIGPDTDVTVETLIADVMGWVGGWGGFRRTGKFEVRIFGAPLTTPAARFKRTDILDLKRGRLPSSLTPPPWRFRVGYQKNETVTTDLAGSVTAARRAFLAEEYRYAEASDTDIKDDHPFSPEHPAIGAGFRNLADAQTEADRLLALYRVSRAFYTISLGVEPFGLDLGDTVNVTHNRFDLTQGRNMVIVEFVEDAGSNSVQIVAYG
jgi:hypothetical protein